ncbi:hypothetical protein IB286_04360 [Spongiibacter sp. KMU-158]|uniref:Acyl-CoA thioester hydrolase n=1 Tax=Spongiibacter pelagi TaxID=2760804 RepID=A0A927C1D2_9GAMM|nr:thioesterase family protein [Spongiibacter pelagi]MBD2858232.1 hypothetical protein [Spongiibacter pelagi]
MKETPDAHRLILDNYPHILTIETRYGDMDSYAHLNNSAIGRIYENSRAQLHMGIFDSTNFHRADSPAKTLLVETRTRFFAEGHYPGSVTLGTGIGRIGNSSYQIQQALFQDGQCLGVCDATMVYTVDGKPTALEGDLRLAFEKMLIKA